MNIAILAAALLLQPLPAPGNVQWERIGEGDTVYDEIDPSTIVRAGDIVSYTSRPIIVPPGEDGITMMVVRNARNCRTGLTGFSGIDGYNAEGRRVASRRTRPAKIAYHGDSAGPRAPMVHRRVCGAPAS